MTTVSEGTRVEVVRVEQSLGGTWVLTLSCGHTLWLPGSAAKPERKTATCVQCEDTR